MTFVKTKTKLGKVETKSKRQLQTRRAQHQSQNVHIHLHNEDKPKPKRKRNTKPKPINNYGKYDREASIYSQTNSPYEDMMAQNRSLKPTINYTIPAQQQALALITNKNNDLITEFLQNNNKKPLALQPSEPTTHTTLLLQGKHKEPEILEQPQQKKKTPMNIKVGGYKPMQYPEMKKLRDFAGVDSIEDLKVLRPDLTENKDYTKIYEGIKKYKEKGGQPGTYTQEEKDRLTQHKDKIENEKRQAAIAKALQEENKKNKAEEEEKKKIDKAQKKALKEAEEERKKKAREEANKQGKNLPGRQPKNNNKK